MITTAEQAASADESLKAFVELRRNPAYKELHTKIDEAFHNALDGLSNRVLTAEKRAEFLEAYHELSDISGFVARRIEQLTTDLNDFKRRMNDQVTEVAR